MAKRSAAENAATFRRDLSDPRHGTVNGYGNLKCRCESCCQANTREMRRRRQIWEAATVPPHTEGKGSDYRTRRCRCELCKEAHLAPRRKGRRSTWHITEGMKADYESGLSVSEVAQKWNVEATSVYVRLRAAGVALRTRRISTGALYWDYCTGLSVQEVAQRWECSIQCVYHRFSDSHLPLRPKPPGRSKRGTNPALAGKGFIEANQARTELAVKQHREAWLLALTLSPSPSRERILNARLSHPDWTLAKLAAHLGVTKDVVASHLSHARRAARKTQEALPTA